MIAQAKRLVVDRARPTPPSATAMTLIEILVVMSIMIILVSSIVVAAFSLHSRGQISGTKGVIDQLAMALAAYKTTYRMYVPADAADAQANSTLPLWQALEREEKITTVIDRYKKETDAGADPKTGALFKRYIYIDAWSQPLYYECAAPFQRFRLTSGGRDLLIGSVGSVEAGDNIVKE